MRRGLALLACVSVAVFAASCGSSSSGNGPTPDAGRPETGKHEGGSKHEDGAAEAGKHDGGGIHDGGVAEAGKHDGGGADSGKAGPVHLSGALAKGPFVQGSSVIVSPTDALGNPTGTDFQTSTTDDLGDFSLTFTYQGLALLTGTGFYFNEEEGALSGAQITLKGFTEVTQSGSQTRPSAPLRAHFTRIQPRVAPGGRITGGDRRLPRRLDREGTAGRFHGHYAIFTRVTADRNATESRARFHRGRGCGSGPPAPLRVRAGDRHDEVRYASPRMAASGSAANSATRAARERSRHSMPAVEQLPRRIQTTLGGKPYRSDSYLKSASFDTSRYPCAPAYLQTASSVARGPDLRRGGAGIDVRQRGDEPPRDVLVEQQPHAAGSSNSRRSRSAANERQARMSSAVSSGKSRTISSWDIPAARYSSTS